MTFALCKREREQYYNERVAVFTCDKHDVHIYWWARKELYVVALTCMICTSEFAYFTIHELLNDAETRKFFEPFEFSKEDYERLDIIRKTYN